MSHFWIIIVLKKQAEQFREDYYYNYKAREFSITEETSWMKKDDFTKIEKILKNYESYVFFWANDYLSIWEKFFQQRLEQKTKALRKKWWSDTKIQDFEEEFLRKEKLHPHYQKKLDFIAIMEELSRKYKIIFWYYWDSRDWDWFKSFKEINKWHTNFDEWTLYQYKK